MLPVQHTPQRAPVAQAGSTSERIEPGSPPNGQWARFKAWLPGPARGFSAFMVKTRLVLEAPMRLQNRVVEQRRVGAIETKRALAAAERHAEDVNLAQKQLRHAAEPLQMATTSIRNQLAKESDVPREQLPQLRRLAREHAEVLQPRYPESTVEELEQWLFAASRDVQGFERLVGVSLECLTDMQIKDELPLRHVSDGVHRRAVVSAVKALYESLIPVLTEPGARLKLGAQHLEIVPARTALSDPAKDARADASHKEKIKSKFKATVERGNWTIESRRHMPTVAQLLFNRNSKVNGPIAEAWLRKAEESHLDPYLLAADRTEMLSCIKQPPVVFANQLAWMDKGIAKNFVWSQAESAMSLAYDEVSKSEKTNPGNKVAVIAEAMECWYQAEQQRAEVAIQQAVSRGERIDDVLVNLSAQAPNLMNCSSDEQRAELLQQMMPFVRSAITGAGVHGGVISDAEQLWAMNPPTRQEKENGWS